MFGFRPRVAIERDGQWLERDDQKIWLAWKRHAQAKRMKLLISADGPRLTLPPRASGKSAETFVAEHEDWIWQQVAKHQPITVAPLQIGVSGLLPLFGKQIPVLWRPDKALQVFRYDSHWQIHTSARSSEKQLQAALLNSYQQIGEAWFMRSMQRYLPDLPQAPSDLRVKPLRSLWGSLNVANAVSLDVALLLAPEPVAEYVLVHELCHLLQRNHSPKFWREVETRSPDWREQRDYLKKHGQGLKAEAKRLFG